MNNTNLAWVDIETAGLDPRSGHILEIAIIATDPGLTELAHVSLVVRPVAVGAALAVCDSTVLRMHTKNGLFADVLDNGLPLRTVEESCVDFMRVHGIAGTPMCGSTISFDRAWLRSYMADLHNAFHYRNIDVSSLKELARRWLPNEEPPPKREAHRALDDARESIDVARFYRERFSRGFTL